MQPRRPPSLLRSCGVLPGLSSFPHFERDPRGPSESLLCDIAALKDRLPTGGRVSQRIMARYFWDTILGIKRSFRQPRMRPSLTQHIHSYHTPFRNTRFRGPRHKVHGSRLEPITHFNGSICFSFHRVLCALYRSK
jgi:hypothetical protein